MEYFAVLCADENEEKRLLAFIVTDLHSTARQGQCFDACQDVRMNANITKSTFDWEINHAAWMGEMGTFGKHAVA